MLNWCQHKIRSFYQDGTIGFEVKATGELSTNLLVDGADPAGYGTIVFPNVNSTVS